MRDSMDIVHTKASQNVVAKARAHRGLWSLPPILIAMLALSGCATTYRPKVTGLEPFAFTPTPEQCAQLRKERRTYRATERTSVWVGGSGALVATAFAAIPALRDEAAVQGASAAVALAAGAVAIFSGSQVESLDGEIHEGQCR